MNLENTLAEDLQALTKRVDQLEEQYQKSGTIKEEQQIVSNEKEAELQQSLEQNLQLHCKQLEATVQKQSKELADLQAKIQCQQLVGYEKEAELLGLLEKQQAKIDELEVSNQVNQQECNQLEATVQKQEKLIYELQPSIESLIEQDADQIKNSLAKVSFEQIIETAKNEFGIFELQNFENEFAKVCQLITNKIKQL